MGWVGVMDCAKMDKSHTETRIDIRISFSSNRDPIDISRNSTCEGLRVELRYIEIYCRVARGYRVVARQTLLGSSLLEFHKNRT